MLFTNPESNRDIPIWVCLAKLDDWSMEIRTRVAAYLKFIKAYRKKYPKMGDAFE